MNPQKKNTLKIVSPGRACLFGDHQDYLGLPVIACAISRHITLTAIENDLGKLYVEMPDIGKRRAFPTTLPDVITDKKDHFLTALKILESYDCIPNRGYTVTLTGNIAINAGTSSSTALLVAWIQFLLEAFGCNREVDNELVARITYQAEVTYHNLPGGKMDQYSIGMGNIIYLETGDELQYRLFKRPLPGLIIAESGIPKKTVGVLSEVKGKAIQAVTEIKKKNPAFELKIAQKSDLKQYLEMLPKDLQPFMEAAIRNHDLTRQALKEFQKQHWDIEKIGRLMSEHHKVLSGLLDVSLPAIDKITNAALQAGAYGAKIVGSGRGGCIVALAPEEKQNEVIDAMQNAGAVRAYAVEVDPGVRQIDENQCFEPVILT